MTFDDGVDAECRRLRDSRADFSCGGEKPNALRDLLSRVEMRLGSRRLSFTIENDARHAVIEIAHGSGGAIGVISSRGEGFAFTTQEFDYFGEFVSPDAGIFIERLYETLKKGLAQYEFDMEN